MKKNSFGIVCATLVAALTTTAFADTLFLKNGERVSGYYEGGTTRVVRFRGADGQLKDYDILGVERLQFGDVPQAAVPMTIGPGSVTSNSTAVPTIIVGPPRLQAERPVPIVPAPVGGPSLTIPTGTRITIRLVDSINSEKQQAGSVFVAVLDEPIAVNDVTVAPRGADVRGRITTVSPAGRGNNGAQLGLELTNLVLNGVSYALTTSEYSEVADEKEVKAGRRAVGGAGIGALIGAIAGGGRGAAIGAGVGGGAGVASAVLTKGEKLSIPSETRLQFTLRTPLIVAVQ